jgi:hypothetical protein
MRFKKRLSIQRLFGKTPLSLVLNITATVPYSMAGMFLFADRRIVQKYLSRPNKQNT